MRIARYELRDTGRALRVAGNAAKSIEHSAERIGLLTDGIVHRAEREQFEVTDLRMQGIAIWQLTPETFNKSSWHRLFRNIEQCFQRK